MDEKPLEALDAGQLAELCRAAQQGDAQALERLLWQHHARLLNYARRRIGVEWRQKLDAEELLQEAFVDVFRGIAGFQPRGEDSFYHWVTRMIDHRFVDGVRHFRRKKRDIARETVAAAGDSSFDLLLERCAAAVSSPSFSSRREDARRALLTCMAQLPEHYRLVIQRIYLEEQSLAAVAAELERTDDAVRRLAGRALEQLAACLGRASRLMSSMG